MVSLKAILHSLIAELNVKSIVNTNEDTYALEFFMAHFNALKP